MKDAAVYGARQPFGFELCTQLLERGYCVYAVDHEYWMRESDEEKWLFIGRNANLRYFGLKNGNDDAALPFQPQRHCLFFIPVIDYAVRHVPEVTEQLIRQVETISQTDQSAENCLVWIHPPASKRNQGAFFKKLHAVYAKWKADNLPALEYCVPEKITRNGPESDPLPDEAGFWRKEIEYILNDVEEKVCGWNKIKK
jgi:hypothetical protein